MNNDINALRERANMLRTRIIKGWVFKALLCEHIRLNALNRAKRAAEIRIK